MIGGRLRRHRHESETLVLSISLRVNGDVRRREEAPDATLLSTLRRLGLTGAKEACGRGECGACTVLIDGVPRLACTEISSLVTGDVTTAEGLGAAGDAVRESFAEHSAFQCGYCTPGLVVTACAIVAEEAPQTRGDLRRRISGNICRCTGYGQVLDAVESARRRLGGR